MAAIRVVRREAYRIDEDVAAKVTIGVVGVVGVVEGGGGGDGGLEDLEDVLEDLDDNVDDGVCRSNVGAAAPLCWEEVDVFMGVEYIIILCLLPEYTLLDALFLICEEVSKFQSYDAIAVLDTRYVQLVFAMLRGVCLL